MSKAGFELADHRRRRVQGNRVGPSLGHFAQVTAGILKVGMTRADSAIHRPQGVEHCAGGPQGRRVRCSVDRVVAKVDPEVVKVTDSVPGPGRPHRRAEAGVVKAGMANAVGAYGQRLAARDLSQAGMAILDRSWRRDQGGIDIVAMDDPCLVMLEVKTRRSLSFGSPVEAVTALKAARLRRLAGCWMADQRSLVASVADVRIDVIGVLRPSRGPAQIEHLESVAA